MNTGLKKVQIALTQAGYAPGPADGVWGDRTARAIQQAATDDRLLIAPAKAKPAPVGRVVGGIPVINSPAYRDIESFYGKAGGKLCTEGRVALPFPFLIAWDKDQRIETFACHALLAKAMTSIYAEAAKHYGEAEFRRLRLDLFGGCFNHRPMRGGTALSTHAYGAAVDHDPQRNQLKWGRDRAAFAQPAYDVWWGIVEAHGAVSLGRAKNYDWMHFQFVKP